MTDQSPTRDELIERLEGELAEMASACSVQMELWDRFSNRVLRAISLLRSDSQRIAELEGALKTLRLTLQLAALKFGFDLTGSAVIAHLHEQRARFGLERALAKLKAAPLQGDGSSSAAVECHGLDTPERVCFYEQDFYVLSNFSAFNLKWAGWTFPTLEHAYHWEKFAPEHGLLRAEIRQAPSAHEAFRTAQSRKADRRADWDEVKVRLMKGMLREKAHQHEYVRRKLLATGDRELVENSWRDDFWGWGPSRDGQNMLGKLWMEVRAELRVTEGSGVLSLAPDTEIPSASGSEQQ